MAHIWLCTPNPLSFLATKISRFIVLQFPFRCFNIKKYAKSFLEQSREFKAIFSKDYIYSTNDSQNKFWYTIEAIKNMQNNCII